MYYYYIKERKSYNDAKMYCGEPGFHFPVVMTNEQYNVVRAFFSQIGGYLGSAKFEILCRFRRYFERD